MSITNPLKLIVIILFSVIISSAPALCTEPFKLLYELQVVDTSKHLTHIDAIFVNFPADSARLKLPSYFDGDRYIELSNVSVKTADGKNNLPFSKEDVTYVVQNGQCKNFVFSYDLIMNQRNLGYLGYLCDTYLLSNSAWTFVAPDGVIANQYRVLFKLPPGWAPVTPWSRYGKGFIVTTFRDFAVATYGCGTFEIMEKTVKNTDVVIAIDSKFSREFKDTASANCFKIFEYIKTTFGADGPDIHFSVFPKSQEPTPSEWQYVNESGLSQGEAVDNYYSVYYQFAHRIFHTYNSYAPEGMDIRPLWFLEGMDEYYSILALMNINYDIPLSGLAYRYNYVYKSGLDKYDGPISASGRTLDDHEREQYLYYHKGALVCYLLDRYIREISDGKRTLKDILYDLYDGYGQFQNGFVTNDQILNTTGRLTKHDVSGFFNDYIYGSKPLDMDDLFLDNDGDSVCNGGEDILKTDRNKKDTDGDGVVDGFEYKYGTDPLDPRSYPNLPLYVDGFSSDWDRIKYNKMTDGLGNKVSIMKEVDYTMINDNYYILLRMNNTSLKDPSKRYYANIDVDSDGVAELQVAAVFGSYGDMSKFRDDMTNYAQKPLDNLYAPESAVSNYVEYKIPSSFIGRKNKIAVTFGIWDTKNNVPIENTSSLNLFF